jgi:spore maturation protein CgeB
MAANSKYYHPIKCNFKYDVSFIGNNYAKRTGYIYQLLENNIDVHCFGPNWLINRPYEKLKKIQKELIRVQKLLKAILSVSETKRYSISSEIQNYDFQCFLRNKFPNNLHYPISDHDMIKLYSQSKINLGFLEVFALNNDTHSYIKQHLHLREFEIPMSGGLYFTNYSEELSEHYVPDKEVIVFNNENELLDKVTFFLNNPKLANSVREAGHRRALNCHTYQKRFLKLFEEIL